MQAQADTLTSQQIVGRWSVLMIEKTELYSGLSDTLKKRDTVSVLSFPINPVYEIYEDGTFILHGDFMEGDTVTGTWQLHGDTLIIYDSDKEETDHCAVRCIAPGRMELIYRGRQDATATEPVVIYFLWEKLE